MIAFVYLVSLLLGVDVACGAIDSCNLDNHIAKNTKWSYISFKNHKGETVVNAPLPRVSPFASTTEEEINKQINRELFAHYTYLSMAMHFDRDDINLPGFHKFFKESSDEELQHAHKLMEYQNKRGGRVKLHNIMTPCKDHWGSGLDAMKDALALEKHVYQSLLDLHSKADANNDPQMQDFLESEYLGEQVESIKELSNYVNTLTRLHGPDGANYALGEYQFDKVTLGGGSKTAA
ncbi:hypothetical protein ACROYT_G029704 [Oculina patagonica]